ncbi:hypothetical protein V8C35DRAFT_65703 [Trichoderma chlorosporum]
MIHKNDFGREYNRWWSRKQRNASLPIQWTCLLLMLCACACQHLPIDIQKKLEKMLGKSCQESTESFHHAARYLYSAMPADRYHKNNVLWLLHSTYWYKAEAMFSEACHVFYTAVREAQALGFDSEVDASDVPNFELEMRRRAWCVIDSWDWQLASGLSRGTMVDHSTCNAKRPSLTLEPDGEFSPLMHMNMQSDLVHKLARRFPNPSQIKTRSDIMEYKGVIDEWMQNFPPIFALVNPDTSNDKRQAWIEYHRHYNYTMGYMMVLNPFRSHMALSYNDESSADELELRKTAIDLTLRIVQVLDNWLKFLTFRDGRFHFIIFSLCDAAIVLSNVVLNDKAKAPPRRDDVYRAMKTILVLQRKLYYLSESAKVGFRIVQRIARHLFRSTSKEYLASLDDDGDHDHDDAETGLPAASDQASGGALMNVQNIDPEDPIVPGLWDEPVAEVPSHESDVGTGSQLVHDVAPVASSCDSGMSKEYSECVEPQMLSEHQAIAFSQSPLPIAATFDSTERTVSTDATCAPQDYISPASLHYASSSSPSYVTAIDQDQSATTPTYVEPTLPGHDSVSSSNYVSTASSTAGVIASFAGSAPPAQTNDIVSTSFYVEPVLADHVSYALPSYGMDAYLNDTTEYDPFYAAGTSPAHTAAPAAYVDPAHLSTHSLFASSKYIAATPAFATEPDPNTQPSSAFTPTILTDGATFDTCTPYLPWTDYDVELYATPKSHNSFGAYDSAMVSDAPSTFAANASYTSPESYASCESYLNPPMEYSTPSSSAVPTTYAASTLHSSSSDHTSPESHVGLGDYIDAPSTAAGLPHLDGKESAYAVFTPYETPEAYYTASAYTTPLDNSASPDMEPPA